MEYFVYILKGVNGHLYTGIARDVARRLSEHNGERSGGAKYTRAHRPYQLVYTEMCASRSAALKREHAIKSFSRREKLSLVSGK